MPSLQLPGEMAGWCPATDPLISAPISKCWWSRVTPSKQEAEALWTTGRPRSCHPASPRCVAEMPAGERGRRAGSSRACFDADLKLSCCDRETTSKVRGAETLPTRGMCNYPRCHPSHGVKASICLAPTSSLVEQRLVLAASRAAPWKGGWENVRDNRRARSAGQEDASSREG